MKEKSRGILNSVLICSFGVFLVASLMIGFEPGTRIGRTFVATLTDMMKILPCAFVLASLLDTWVKRETVEKHFGETSGFRGYIGALLLASTTIGGIYVAFPIAYSLHRKGAKLGVVFSYIGLSGACRIPMMMFEASFMGMTFTVVRLAVTVPLVYLSSLVLARFLTKRGYRLSE